MPESAVIARFERRLVELGCPAARLRSSVRELGDHHEDLKQAALEEGLSEPAAGARADELLGEPVSLAGQVSAVLRQSSWFGRHPFITFCLLPLIALLLLACLGLAFEILASRYYFTRDELNFMAGDKGECNFANNVLFGTWWVVITLTAALFCWLAMRTSSGLKWALVTCVVCAFYSCCAGFQLYPHTLTFYWSFPPVDFSRNWISLTGPMLLAVAVWLRRMRRLHQFPVPDPPDEHLPMFRPPAAWLRTGFFTPSSVIAAFAVAALVALVLGARSHVLQAAARDNERIDNIWPAERATVLQQLKRHQSAVEVPGTVTINLKPWLNAALADSLGGPSDTNRNNLAALPRGLHVFAGVPFDVEGRLQLMGGKLLDTTTAFPTRVRNIQIAAKCRRLHLLHGANAVSSDLNGTNIAVLVLHYADGSTARVPIVGGANVLDWWGPIYETGVGQGARDPSASNSELAWAGSNPAIQDQEPQSSLRLYQSTFDNPQPDKEITSLDYVSTMTDASPFLVGLTLE